MAGSQRYVLSFQYLKIPVPSLPKVEPKGSDVLPEKATVTAWSSDALDPTLGRDCIVSEPFRSDVSNWKSCQDIRHLWRSCPFTTCHFQRRAAPTSPAMNARRSTYARKYLASPFSISVVYADVRTQTNDSSLFRFLLPMLRQLSVSCDPKLILVSPAGNFYSISNPGKNPARIFFAQGNEMVAGTAGGDVSS